MRWLVTPVFLLLTLGWASVQPTSFFYTLTSDAATSAGVFDSTGALIRTLWSAEPKLAGRHKAVWDGLTDAGTSASTGKGTYTFKVLSNNVIYHWDGIIGNTESAWLGTHNQWDGLGYELTSARPTFIGTTALVASGYSEGTSNLFAFDTSTPNTPHPINPAYANQNVMFGDSDNDGAFVYLSNAQVWSGENFVTKFTTAGVPAAFTTGKAITGKFSWSGIPMNGINIYSDKANIPVSIAVQNTGNILAVAYSGKRGTVPVINFYDKTSGSAIGTPVTLTAQATSMGFTSAGLWYVSNGGLYLLASPSVSSTASQPITGLSNVVYVATNKTLNSVVVMDGGTHQQVFEYNSLLALKRTYGTLGGYASNGYDPTITNSKMMLDATANRGTKATNGSWVKVDNNDGLWICDAGDAERILHVDSTNTYVNQIQFGQEQYALAVSLTMPTRIFRHGIEYAIDYTKPLLPGDPSAPGGNGSWRMVKNWEAGAEGANGSPANVDMVGGEDGIQNAERLSNGRVYGLINNCLNRYEVEFPAFGPLRYTTGKGIPGGFELETDGSWEYASSSGTDPNKTETISKSYLTGFDTNGNPIRAAYFTLGTVAYNSSTQAALQNGGWGGPQSYQATTSSVIPMYQTSPVAKGFPHLGGMQLGRSDSPLFETYPEASLTTASFHGIFPSGSAYGGHAGQRAQALGTSIFTGYDGQYAPWGQTYCQWYQDGLLVGCYGLGAEVTGGGFKVADSSGNISTEQWVRVGSDVYMYHTTESQLTMIHRWHISNLSSVYEVTGSSVIGSSVNLQ